MEKWHELEGVASSISLIDDTDALIWQYENKGVYSTSSLYAIINFGGVTPIYIPSIWDLCVPPRIHIFLWLLANNKLMTRDNLKKRNMNKPEDCIFCSENESIDHLFFQCIVANQLWHFISDFFDVHVGNDYFSIAKLWIANKKYADRKSVV